MSRSLIITFYLSVWRDEVRLSHICSTEQWRTWKTVHLLTSWLWPYWIVIRTQQGLIQTQWVWTDIRTYCFILKFRGCVVFCHWGVKTWHHSLFWIEKKHYFSNKDTKSVLSLICMYIYKCTMQWCKTLCSGRKWYFQIVTGLKLTAAWNSIFCWLSESMQLLVFCLSSRSYFYWEGFE